MNLPFPAGPAGADASHRLERVTGLVALAGGMLALGVAALVVVSVLGRWLFSAPVEGDFEMVKMATAIAIFSYLPFTQAKGGNIRVDTFTARLGPRACRLIDAGWDLAYAAFMALCALGLFTGTVEAFRSGETTMQLQWAVWPAIGLCALLAVLLSVTAVRGAFRLAGSRS